MAPQSRTKSPLVGEVAGLKPVLFVDGLELQKGIGTLLAAIPSVLAGEPSAVFWIAGRSDLPLESGGTRRSLLEESDAGRSRAERVRFLGDVDERELRWLYAACELFVAPSCSETLGLPLMEAAMFEKAAVGEACGGMQELIEEGLTGCLVRPGDVQHMATTISALLGDDVRRRAMGLAGRRAYERRHAASISANRRLELCEDIVREPIDITIYARTGGPMVSVLHGVDTVFLEAERPLRVRIHRPLVHLSFYRHELGGVAEVRIDGRVAASLDLYDPGSSLITIQAPVPPGGGELSIVRTGARNAASAGDEVMVAQVAQSVR